MNKQIHYAASGSELLTIAFIVLKLTGTIKWSWWWVLSPVWISALLILPVVIWGIFYVKRH